jgi:hypothetical protein
VLPSWSGKPILGNWRFSIASRFGTESGLILKNPLIAKDCLTLWRLIMVGNTYSLRRRLLEAWARKSLKRKTAVFGLMLMLLTSLLVIIYSPQLSASQETTTSSQASFPLLSTSGTTGESSGGASQLTFLDQEVFAFNVPPEWVPNDTNHHYWHEYSFGSIMPSNAIMALCMLKLTGVGNPYGGSDIAFATQDPKIEGPTGWFGGQETVAGSTMYSMGADIIWFDGTVFAYVATENGSVWACNPGNVCGVDVYVIGYVTEAINVRGFYFDFATKDYAVVSGSASTNWTDINVTSILPSHSGYDLIGLYIALDSPTAKVDISFRAEGKTGDGVVYETCTNDPGTHLIGLIPASDVGFQYRASSGASIGIYVEGFIFSCPLTDGDKFVYQVPSTIQTVTQAWATSPSYATNVKAITSAPAQYPGAIGQYKCRGSGAGNEQIWYKKNSCGMFYILTPLGQNKAFEYWTNPTGDASTCRIEVGSIILQSSPTVH